MTTNLVHRRELFWEVSPDRIPEILRHNEEWVIPRVFEYGELEDIWDVIHYYGEDKVKEVLERADLGRVAASMAHLFLDLKRK